MKRVLVSGLATIFCLLAPMTGANAQGVWKELTEAGKTARSSKTEYPVKSPQDVCMEAETDIRALKCRGSYLSKDFAISWRGAQYPGISHGPIVEILVRGDDAVVCFNDSYDMTDTSPCLPMRKVN